MSTVNSRDGTSIAYERWGHGPAVILVDGALCSRAFGPMPKLAPPRSRHTSPSSRTTGAAVARAATRSLRDGA